MRKSHCHHQLFAVNYLYYVVLTISLISLIPLFTIIFNSSIFDYTLFFLKNNESLEYFVNSFVILFWVLLFTFIFGLLSAYLVTFFNFYGVNFFKYSR